MNLRALHPVGVAVGNGSVFLYSGLLGPFGVAKSATGFQFFRSQEKPIIFKKPAQKDDLKTCQDFRVTQDRDRYLLAYRSSSRKQLYVADSNDLMRWNRLGKVGELTEPGAIVADYRYQGDYLLYSGGKSIRLASSSNLVSWKIAREALVKLPEKSGRDARIIVDGAFLIEEGVLVFYQIFDKRKQYSTWAVIFDEENPKKIIWESDGPVWEQYEEWAGKKLRSLGTVRLSESFVTYWQSEGEGVLAVVHGRHPRSFTKHVKVKLERYSGNPIIEPKEENPWESKATFNPAAIYENGQVHLIYRAIGEGDMSVLGHAVSNDGYRIQERSDRPMYIPRAEFEGFSKTATPAAWAYMSGGGYGGCEDPRITKVEDTMFMTYVAFDGGSPPRVALSKIEGEDFRNRNWDKWSEPVLISEPGIVNKNACVLPEKINGKYVIFHRVYPDILVDYMDDLDFDGETKWLRGDHRIKPRSKFWDSRKVGIGAPPVKTDEGWLLIYQSVGEQDPGKYKLGAMLLDLEKPEKVLYRSNFPILEPDFWYENKGWKSGVAYPCGAVIKDGTLFVYYGGADTVVCVATAPINQFLAELKHSRPARLEKVTII